MLLCTTRSKLVLPHKVLIEVSVRNVSNKRVTIASVDFDIKSTWIGVFKGSLENVPSLPIDVERVETLEETVVVSPTNDTDESIELLQSEQFSYQFVIAIRPHLAYLVQKNSLATEFVNRVKFDPLLMRPGKKECRHF